MDAATQRIDSLRRSVRGLPTRLPKRGEIRPFVQRPGGPRQASATTDDEPAVALSAANDRRRRPIVHARIDLQKAPRGTVAGDRERIVRLGRSHAQHGDGTQVIDHHSSSARRTRRHRRDRCSGIAAAKRRLREILAKAGDDDRPET